MYTIHALGWSEFGNNGAYFEIVKGDFQKKDRKIPVNRGKLHYVVGSFAVLRCTAVNEYGVTLSPWCWMLCCQKLSRLKVELAVSSSTQKKERNINCEYVSSRRQGVGLVYFIVSETKQTVDTTAFR